MSPRHAPLTLVLAGLSLLLTACGQPTPQWTGIDLDRVLELTEETLDASPDTDLTAKVAPPPQPTAEGEPAPIDAANDPDAAAAVLAFTERLEEKLNTAGLHREPLGVTMVENGGLMGYASRPPFESFGPEDPPLFLIQIDAANDRLIASDLQDPEVHRDRGYGFSPGGFFTGYLLGSMLSGQRGYYGGGGPNFNRMNMAPQGYARSGSGFTTNRSRASAAARTARSSSGSRSFLGGK